MEATTALRTNGAVRGFTDDPVSDAVVAELLDDARFAPSGGNQQPWRVAVVKSPEVRTAMAALMRPVWEEYQGAQRAGKRAGRRQASRLLQLPPSLRQLRARRARWQR